ncbi:MAG: hypothetical protein AABZ08_02305 [Planctomycetota bacterium]
MRSLTPTLAPPRRPGLRRIIEERAWVRHPVSTTRQRFSFALLVFIVVGFGTYLYNTRDDAIRHRVIAFLEDATAGEVKVGQAHFRMFGGITLDNVQVSAPYDEQLDPTAKDPFARKIFSASSLSLIHNPWRLLFGSLTVDHIIAAEPTITLVHNVDTGLRNWQLLGRPDKPKDRSKKRVSRPRITIRNAKAVAVSVHADGLREWRTEELDADIRAQPQSDTGFCIEIRRFSDPAERTTVVFDPATKLVTNTPFVDARTVRLQLPKLAQQFFDQINLQGEVKLGRLVYSERTAETMDTEIQLRRVRCAVPLAMLKSDTDARLTNPSATREETLATLTDATGRVALRAGKLELDLTGHFNGAKCAVKGTVTHVERGLTEMGIDVHLQGAKIAAPTDAALTQITTDPAVPESLRAFFMDYNPQGNFDVDLNLRREAGPAQQVELFGTVKPLGVTGNCRFFPYAVSELQGIIRVEGPLIFLENITGTHGPGSIKLNAQIDRRTAWSDVRIDVTCENIPLDETLYAGLSDHHRELWRRFNPRGASNMQLRLRRPKALASDPWPTWKNHVDADLVDARIEFAEYPYPLDRVGGKLILDDDRIQFIALTGHRDDATVQFDGDATFPIKAPSTVNLRIDARNIPLDQTLAKSLPPEGRGAFEQFQPQGRIDLAGKITLDDPAVGLRYDLLAKISDAAISYQQFPYRIADVVGEIALRPDGISLVNISGRHGNAVITARGDITRQRDGYIADLIFDCQKLSLDAELLDALPPSLRAAWNMLNPRGVVQIQTALHHVSTTDRSEQRHRSRLKVDDASFCFSGFPIALTSVTGDLVVTDRLVEINSLRGRNGDSDVSFSGRMILDDKKMAGTLAVDAKRLAFGKTLLDALPADLRRPLEAIKPVGAFDLHLDPLQFDTNADGKTRWAFAGEMDVRDVGAEVGISITHGSGKLFGKGALGTDGSILLETRAALDQATLAGWELQDLRGRITKDADSPRLDFRDVTAAAYGGHATGAAQVRFATTGVDYQLSVVARDMQLERYLASNPTSQPATSLTAASASQGSIDGNVIIRGETGAQPRREGSGEIIVRRAEVWRLPIFFLIFQVLNLTPDENVFHDGWLKFYLEKDEMVFHTIDLQGKALSFFGKGRMNIPTKQLDITLLARSPVRIRLPVLTDVLEAFSREVMEVQISGTFNKPTINPQPLRSLAALIKLFLPPPKPPATTATLSPAQSK